ncbi:hypothetical protein K8I85_11445 [bacterium]|nr:hypothetical protein [bacterium]
MRRRIPIALSFLLLLPAPLRADEPRDTAAILDRVTAAYGGREALAAIAGFRAVGKVLSLSDGMTGKLQLELSLNGDLRSVIRYPHRTETRILAGTMAWSGGEHLQRPAERDMNISMRLQYHRLVAPFELALTEADDLVREDASDEGYIRLRRDWGSQSHTIYEIDPESWYVMRTRGEIGEGDGTLLFETESNDFREVDGILFPFRMTTTVAGHTAAEVILDRITTEDDYDPRRFLPSGGAGDM